MITRWRAAMSMSVAGGLVLGASFPPWSLPWLAPLGVALFVASVASVGRALRRGALTGFVFGVVFLGLTSWWLVESIAFAAWVALTLVQGLWFGLLGAAVALVRRLPAWPAWTACAWTAVESARSAWPWGGFPWGRLGYTAVDTPWVGTLAVLGVAGTGTLIAAAGAGLAALVLGVRSQRPRAAAAVGGAVAVVVVPTAALAAYDVGAAPVGGDDRTARVVVVQAEVPGSGTDVPAYHRAITRTLLEETTSLAGRRSGSDPAPDLVVWPENATAVDPATDREARDSLVAASRVAGAPLLAGSIVDDGETRAANQAIVWTTAGAGARYTKQHLVPFGEYVPLRPLASVLSQRVARIARDMVPGPPSEPILVGDLRIANALCFDVAYDAVIREQVRQEADLVVVQTSNAMFLGTAQQEQQWAITRSRAVEVGRAVVVSSMNGISGVVAADGSVITRLADTSAAAVALDVPIATGTTPAVVLGPWPARSAWTLAALSIAAAAARHRARRNSPLG